MDCVLAFAGRLGGGIYTERTRLVEQCVEWLGSSFRVFQTGVDPHTLFRTPELAASATAVLGFGRPDSPGWVDVRVFQYPGAGGVLLHDDVGGFLDAREHHYVPIPARPERADIEDAIRRAELDGPLIRRAAFAYVQTNHSSVNRVREALSAAGV
jgi:hypothetical protein